MFLAAKKGKWAPADEIFIYIVMPASRILNLRGGGDPDYPGILLYG